MWHRPPCYVTGYDIKRKIMPLCAGVKGVEGAATASGFTQVNVLLHRCLNSVNLPAHPSLRPFLVILLPYLTRADPASSQ